ncbi:DUF4178 domain-containing protein [Novosphingobium sp. G106]|uniref:DUF4178 domain-containing protein n=1 Tax=Novosphingobium sp. G106 TaxID=2849500 RepID=UPI001C2D49B8|nr:DUF4178 domain-containing protein [Novosphingobium sp. G106]MBV1689471.1 DUF4178 domain-containing protein [Novosphingobium sp. G106]
MTAAHSITCPSCGGTIAIKAAGYSVTVACQYCGSVLDVANPDVKVIEEYHQAALSLPLPLGSRGNLFEVEWEVVGYLSRGDGEANWSEYLLFNPYAGYRWLVHAEGDWQYGTMLFDQPDGDNDSVTWRGAPLHARLSARGHDHRSCGRRILLAGACRGQRPGDDIQPRRRDALGRVGYRRG